MTEDPQAPLAAIAIRQVEKSTGASRNAFEQAAALKTLGYRVTILAERGRRELAEAAGAELVRLKRWPFKGPFRRFWFNRRVQAWCRRHRPAMLVSHGDVETPDVVYMHNCVHLASQRIHGRDLPAGHDYPANADRSVGAALGVAGHADLADGVLVEEPGLQQSHGAVEWAERLVDG
ncbi:glycosyltransferase, partial [Salinicola sp.]|uniref:glycosyltransferase family 4 protein n=1 Tax=Salinicola sp. TaxID=1978524 RepID=UPI0025D11474